MVRGTARPAATRTGQGNVQLTISPTGIIPESLMYGFALGDVMAYIGRLHIDGDSKADLFRGWAQTVGVKLAGSQVNRVRDTGTDRGGPLS